MVFPRSEARLIALLLSALIAAIPRVANSEQLPAMYKTSGQECVVPVEALFRNRAHRDYALPRIFNSFSELALERENKAPLPASGWTWALSDLIFLHIAGDCKNRRKWTQVFIDDYHGRYPDDAQLKIVADHRVAPNFFLNFYFQRIKPIYRVADCRMVIRNPNSELREFSLVWTLFEATKDVYKIIGTRNPQIHLEEGARPDEVIATFLDLCEQRREFIKMIFTRAQEISGEVSGLRIVALKTAEPPNGQFKKSALFRDTREGLHEYLPPRHDVK